MFNRKIHIYYADTNEGLIVLLMFPFMVAGLAMGVIYATRYILTYIECKHTGHKLGTRKRVLPQWNQYRCHS